MAAKSVSEISTERASTMDSVRAAGKYVIESGKSILTGTAHKVQTIFTRALNFTRIPTLYQISKAYIENFYDDHSDRIDSILAGRTPKIVLGVSAVALLYFSPWLTLTGVAAGVAFNRHSSMAAKKAKDTEGASKKPVEETTFNPRNAAVATVGALSLAILPATVATLTTVAGAFSVGRAIYDAATAPRKEDAATELTRFGSK